MFKEPRGSIQPLPLESIIFTDKTHDHVDCAMFMLRRMILCLSALLLTMLTVLMITAQMCTDAFILGDLQANLDVLACSKTVQHTVHLV